VPAAAVRGARGTPPARPSRLVVGKITSAVGFLCWGCGLGPSNRPGLACWERGCLLFASTSTSCRMRWAAPGSGSGGHLGV
jgi:hypothetical protein